MKPHECDEDCRACEACWRVTGETICQELCPHAAPADEDDEENAHD